MSKKNYECSIKQNHGFTQNSMSVLNYFCYPLAVLEQIKVMCPNVKSVLMSDRLIALKK